MQTVIGETIGRYKVIEELGRGGLAVVYRAVDTTLERSVALKMILPDQQQSERYLRRFHREARALAQLSHPNIVKILDYGDYQGVPYLVMEYISGGTLSSRMGRIFSYQEAAGILAPIARALHHAHQHKIIHRDVKPANILINESDQPMLSDFGIVKLTESDESQSLTGTGALIGTPAYMAPEQIQGKPVDARADVYALGIVLFELLTGRKPYVANTPIELTLKHLNEPVPRPRQYMRDLPPEVEQVVLKSMAKKPEDRYQDMAAFAAVLEDLAASQRSASRSTTRRQDTRPHEKKKQELKTWAKSKKGLYIGIGVVAALAMLGVAAFFLIPKDAPPAALAPTATIATIVSANTTGPTETPTLPPEKPTQPPATSTATLPAATNTVEPAKPTATATPSVITIQLNNLIEILQLNKLERTSVIQLDWTKDGKSIIDAGASAIYMIDPATMKTTGTISLNSVPKSLALTSDSQTALLLIGNQIRKFSLADRKETLPAISLQGQGGANSMALSPDDKTIALGMLDNKVLLVDAVSGNVSRLMRSNYGGWCVAFSPDSRLVAAGTSQGALMWEAATGTWQPINTGQNELIKSIAFSNDGKWLAGGADGSIHIWDVATGNEVMNLTGKFTTVNSLKFLIGDKLLVAAADDNSVRIWDLEGKREGIQLKGHVSPVYSVAVSPDGRSLVSGANEGVIRLWGLP